MADSGNSRNLTEAANLLLKASNMLTSIAEQENRSSSSASENACDEVSRRISQSVRNARAMIRSSSSAGTFRRLARNERLRAGTNLSQRQKKEKNVDSKALEYALLRAKEESESDEEESLTKDKVIERGILEICENDGEQAIRQKLVSSLEEKYPTLRPHDFAFVKVCQKQISTLNLGKGSEYGYGVVKKLAGQGLLYIRMRPEFQFLIDEKTSSDSELERSPFVVVGNADKKGDIPVPDEVAENQPKNRSSSDNGPVTGSCEKEPSSANEQSFVNERASVNEPSSNTEGTKKGCSDLVTNLIKSFPEEIVNPIEMLRYLQMKICKGRDLEIIDESVPLSGDVNFITVDRDNIIETTIAELKCVKDPRITFEVQFFGEKAMDSGGPRKEWLRLCNRAMQLKYFQNGIKEHLASDYYYVGLVIAITLLQNGETPRYLPEDIIEAVFSSNQPISPAVRFLKQGLDSLGLAEFGRQFHLFTYLLRPTDVRLNGRILIHLLAPKFSEAGSNAFKWEKEIYAKFVHYVREVESGRRIVTLEEILEFATGVSEVPPLGFGVEPHINFNVAELMPVKDRDEDEEATKKRIVADFVPKAHTCTNTLRLPYATTDVCLPSNEELFSLYDLAFKNTYFGVL